MDEELKLYLQEVEQKFEQSKMRHYVFPRFG